MKLLTLACALLLSATSYGSYNEHKCHTDIQVSVQRVLMEVDGLLEYISEAPCNTRRILIDESYNYIKSEGADVSIEDIVETLPPSVQKELNYYGSC